MDNTEKISKIVERQAEMFDELRKQLATPNPKEQDRIKSFRRLGLQIGALAGAAAGAVIGAVEGVNILLEYYQKNQLAARYAEVANSTYHIENNPTVALKFMDQAIDLDDSTKYRIDRAYYASMEVVRDLLNLDRPYTQSELDRAHESLAQALLLRKTAPDSPEPLILLGQIHTVLNEPDKALIALHEAVRLAPGNEFAHLRLGTLLEQQGKNKEALASFDTAIRLNVNYKWAYLWKGVLLGEKLGQWPQARAMYLEAIKLDPRFDLAYYNLGWSYVKAEPADYNQAKKQFEKALSIRPSYKEAFYGLGMMYGYQNEYGIAENYLTKAIELDDNYLTGWKWRGIVRSEQSNWQGALDDYSHAITLNPVDDSLYLRRGFAHEKTGNFNQAAADYRFATQKNPKNGEAWLAQAGLSIKTHEISAAEEDIKKALALEPNSEEAFSLRAELRVIQHQPSRAIEDLSQAIDHATYRPERFLTRRGEILISNGKTREALADFIRARTINENHELAWLGEGKASMKLGLTDQANTAFTRYLSLRPQDSNIRALRQKLTSGNY
jgi:tetratricopeptide (TPR) repeat protein